MNQTSNPGNFGTFSEWSRRKIQQIHDRAIQARLAALINVTLVVGIGAYMGVKDIFSRGNFTARIVDAEVQE